MSSAKKGNKSLIIIIFSIIVVVCAGAGGYYAYRHSKIKQAYGHTQQACQSLAPYLTNAISKKDDKEKQGLKKAKESLTKAKDILKQHQDLTTLKSIDFAQKKDTTLNRTLATYSHLQIFINAIENNQRDEAIQALQKASSLCNPISPSKTLA